MRDVTVTLISSTPYSSSRPIEENLLKGESKSDHEKRRWKEKAHTDENGIIYIPGVAFKMALDEAASLQKEKIKGKGNQTWTMQFRSGVVALTDVSLGVKIDDVKAVPVFCHADGKRSSGTRVWRYFPYIPKWKGEINLRIFNDQISEDVFERYFGLAGIMAGVGRGRPITGCAAGNGRFEPTSFKWSDRS